ncbi:GFA family protein [Roseobacter weihaiensis]|uniref:GFA family protein n=1 Tax=Roseobacter weihaiensis TaxID=2763262 RepID=UPI001D0BC3DF|nr:GFA family protein [Roseobacter sp. H9]
MSRDGETRTARCHCGAVVLEAFLPGGLATAGRCNCSFCRRRGAAAVTALTARVRVMQGADNLTLYTWGTNTAQHYFCKTCGIYTHHQRRSDPAETGINLGCFDGVLPQEFEPLPTTDGINHPKDRPTRS